MRRNQAPEAPVPAQPEPAPRVDSTALFAGRRELVIVHEGREYSLRLTKNRKLILTA